MSDPTSDPAFESFLGDLGVSLNKFSNMNPLEKMQIVTGFNDEVRKRELHEAHMQRLKQQLKPAGSTIEQQQQENDPYKTPSHKSQPGNEKKSPTLSKALGILEDNGIILQDLPTDTHHEGWKYIKKNVGLSPLELSAIQNYRKRLAQEQPEAAIPNNIIRAIQEYDFRNRQPFTSARLNPDISTLYQYKDRPDFLTFRLGQQNYSNDETRAAIKEATKTAPVCVTGVSGAGKTRTALEILSADFGIYFCAGLYLNWSSQPNKPCSADLAWIAEDSDKDMMEDAYALTVRRLECAIIARIMILEKKIELEEGFDALDWTLMQLYPPRITEAGRQCDVFEALTRELYILYDDINAPMVLKRLSARFKYIVVDEAQVAMDQNKERYNNVDKTRKHPFLFAVIRCLWKNGKNSGLCPILCGTGISIMKVSSIAISAVGEIETGRARDKDDKYKLQVPISTVLEPRNIQVLVQEILAGWAYQPHQLGLWSRTLVGRPRLLWGFLASALTDTVGDGQIFERYCLHMTSHQAEGNSTTTLYSCVQKALERGATGETPLSQSVGRAVSEMIVNWLTGQTPAALEEEEKVDVIVNCGVCILERNEDQTKLVARLREPMVVQAYLKYVKTCQPDLIVKTIMAMLEAATEPSSQGFLFELLFYFAFQKWLHGKTMTEAGFAPLDQSSCGFLQETCEIPLECLGNSLLRLPEAPNGKQVGLQSQFLNCHFRYLEDQTKQPKPRAAATPAKKDTDDLVVVAHTIRHVLVFLIQCKLEKQTDFIKAAQTTFPDLLLHQSKKRKLESAEGRRKIIWDYELDNANRVEYNNIQQILGKKKWGDRKVCVVQLVVAHPAKVKRLKETRWIPKPQKPCGNSVELVNLLDRAPQENEEKRLFVVVRGSELESLLGDEVFARLEEVKAKKATGDETVDVPISLSDLLPYENMT